jgi:death-on-curing protein
MAEEIRFLSVDDVLAIQEDTIRHEGGLGGLRDPGLLESAVTMPREGIGGEYLHPDLAAMAAAYLYHLA